MILTIANDSFRLKKILGLVLLCRSECNISILGLYPVYLLNVLKDVFSHYTN